MKIYVLVLLNILYLSTYRVAAEFRITTTLTSFYQNLNEIVQETDIQYTSNDSTIDIGVPYLDATTLKPTRVSASIRSTYTVVPITSVYYSSQDLHSKSTHISTSNESDKTNSHYTDVTSTSQQMLTDTTVTSTPTTSSIVTSYTTSYYVTNDNTPITATTLLTKTASTTSSTIFSSSTYVASSAITGSILTSLSSKTEQPLVTQSMVSSSQPTTVNTNTLISSKTVTTNEVITTVSVITSTSVSSYTTAIFSSQSHTTIISSTTTSVNITTVVSKTTISTLSPASSKTTVSLFEPIDTSAPLGIFQRVPNPTSVANGVHNKIPYETNKFYTNLMLSNQESSAFTYPYTVWKENTHYGLAVQQTTFSQASYGPDYTSFNNPLGISSFIFSAGSFGPGSFNMKVTDMTVSSCLVSLNDGNNDNYIEIPLVQGMGFTTAIYHGNLVPKIKSTVGFETLVYENADTLPQGVLKYSLKLLNGVKWLVYITLPQGSSSNFKLTVGNNFDINGSGPIDGLTIQIAVAPEDLSKEVFYDQAAGMYLTSFQLSGTSDGSIANYAFQYSTEGKSASGATMIFALPHQQKLFITETSDAATGIQLFATTKGYMQAYLTTSFQFSNKINSKLGWLPWSHTINDLELTYSPNQLQELAKVANAELQVNIRQSIQGLNTYFLGKVIDKYAYILLTVSQIIQDPKVTESTLNSMKDAFDLLLTNTQRFPLHYDTKFGGVISLGEWADFGATWYNDHHFHYGYIIHAAAVVGYIDAKNGGTWAQDNKDWVNALIRDVANPTEEDTFFPVSRMFDWFHGHSWASGLFENGNGKNEESSSEDYNFAYGAKLWGQVIGDKSLEYRSDVMISIMSASMNDYFLYSDDNKVEPPPIVKHKVSGILFDNIIDYTTFFGNQIQYIHGIHILPTTPVSNEIRTSTFVSEEWNQILAPIVDGINDGWRGILELGRALFDPKASYEFFSSESFKSQYLDNGMSRTWSLAFSGGIANSLGLLG